MTHRSFYLPALLALAGCTHGPAPSDDSARTLRLGQAGDLGLVTVRPLQVVEDSRCPANVQCVWAGQLRVRAEVEPPIAGHIRTLTLGEPQQVAGGTLVLQAATPIPGAGQAVEPGEYRFIFRYTMPRPD